jgi:hypothetical protein
MTSSPLDGLDDIAWRALDQAYGSAAEIPASLRQLLDSETWMPALGALYGSIYHQGSLYTATPHAAAWLVRIAAFEETPARDQILVLLARLTARESWFAVPGPSLEPAMDDGEHRRLLDATRAAILAEARALMPGLSDRSSKVRAASAFLFGCLPELEHAAKPALRVAIARERNDRVRAAMILALFRLAPSEDDAAHALALMRGPRGGRGEHAPWLSPAPPAQRLACAIALAWALGARAPNDVVTRLHEGVTAAPPTDDDEEAASTHATAALLAAIAGDDVPQRPGPSRRMRALAQAWTRMPWQEHPFGRANAAVDASSALCFISRRFRERAADAIVARMREEEVAPTPLVEALLFLTFDAQPPPPDETRLGRRVDARQHAILDAIATAVWADTGVDARLRSYGLPSTRETLARALEP